MSTAPSRPPRENLTFPSRGTRCAAWLYRPAPAEETSQVPPPIIVMAHGFAGVRGLRLDAFGERFAEAGYAVLIFDYRHFGDSEGEPRRLLSVHRQLDDWRAALSFARSLPEVDTNRVVAWGASLSGGHVLLLGRENPDLAAVITQVPHVCGPVSAAALGVLPALRVAVAGVEDLFRGLFRLPPRYVDSFAEPGALGVLTSPEVAPGRAKMVADSDLPEDAPQDVPARVVLRMPFYAPGRVTGKIAAPVLVQIATKDTITPPFATRMAARRLTKGTVLEYDCGHFDSFVTPDFDSLVSDQLDFLTTQVPVAPGQAPS
jgi:uncharacterized protein